MSISLEHELIVDLLRKSAASVPRLLAQVRSIPAYKRVTVESADITQALPAEYRADLVVLLHGDTKPVLAIVAEVQLSRDEDKRYSWPVYMAAIRARLRCPTIVVVVTTRRTIAKWAARAIPLGPTGTITPVVIGPDALPMPSAQVASLDPHAAVLSMMAHGKSVDVSTAVETTQAMLAALRDDEDLRTIYYDLTRNFVGPLAKKAISMLIENYVFKDPTLRKMQRLKEKAKAEGKADGLRRLLEQRFGALSKRVDARIAGAGMEELDRWFDRILTANSAEAVVEMDP